MISSVALLENEEWPIYTKREKILINNIYLDLESYCSA